MRNHSTLLCSLCCCVQVGPKAIRITWGHLVIDGHCVDRYILYCSWSVTNHVCKFIMLQKSIHDYFTLGIVDVRFIVHVWDVKKNLVRHVYNSTTFSALLTVQPCTSLKVSPSTPYCSTLYQSKGKSQLSLLFNPVLV